jgi:LmbE family N-acetylglucosaminyl deacetylase
MTKPLFIAGLAILCLTARAELPAAQPKQGAELLKTDILGVFAHPDDETGMSATLCYYALGKSNVVSAVYCTRGEGGGNMVGTQAGAALAILREAELRACLSQVGIRYCYFLDQLDWAYTESCAATFRKWGKEETLGRLVRLVRSLRPDVIVTINPAPYPGQHGHHQAAGVLATEAFSAAADSRRFPEQLTKEGLNTWQARKLYYGGGRTGTVAAITVSNLLGNGRSPAQIAGVALASHRSQAFGAFGNGTRPQRPQSFTLAKIFAPSAPESGVVNPYDWPEVDLLNGLSSGDETLSSMASSIGKLKSAGSHSPVSIQFVPRPGIARYRQWVREQNLEHTATGLTADVPLVAGERNPVRISVENSSAAEMTTVLELTVPTGWEIATHALPVRIKPWQTSIVTAFITPASDKLADGELGASMLCSDKLLTTTVRGHPVPRMAAPRLRAPPSLDGTGKGWENLPVHRILPTDLVQGKVANEADSSAQFRIGHDGKSLFVDIEVRDDHVVSNIAPNDIKGHWRSDSVEICIDPAGGAEDTMGCFKVGIFPFDSTGMVRAARDADANQGPIEETAPSMKLISRRTPEGYRIQTVIPFREAGVRSAKNRQIGFNLIIYDGDKPNAALGENINKSRIAWSPRPGVQGRPEDWGRLELE